MKENKKNNNFKILTIVLTVFIVWYISYNFFGNFNNKKQIEKSLQTIQNVNEAYFAWWCFWCVESAFEKYDWVIDSISWYAWWKEENPTYKQVSSWKTWHREAVKVIYDSDKINYNDLLEIFWRTINPTDNWWQYVDRWFQYTSAIFYKDEKQKNLALKSKEQIKNSWRYDKEIVTPIIKFTSFYNAEDYHQDYYRKNPIRYNFYTNWSGRKQYLEKTWWDDLYYEIKSISDLKSRLTPLQYYVTQEDWTEKAFDNEYWNNYEEGIYVDIIDWTPLFSSTHKYKSRTGWPSFTKPIDKDSIKEIADYSFFIKRTEIRSAKSDSHLWHVFNDWPKDKWWLRYCINSASMKFIAKENLEKHWYWKYLALFK